MVVGCAKGKGLEVRRTRDIGTEVKWLLIGGGPTFRKIWGKVRCTALTLQHRHMRFGVYNVFSLEGHDVSYRLIPR